MFDDTRRLWTIKRSDFVTEHDFTSQKLHSMLRKVEASRSWEFHKFWNLGVFWGAQPSKVRAFVYGISSFKKLKDHTCTIGRVHPLAGKWGVHHRKVRLWPAKRRLLATKKGSNSMWLSTVLIKLNSHNFDVFFPPQFSIQDRPPPTSQDIQQGALAFGRDANCESKHRMQPKIGAWHSLTSTNWDCTAKPCKAKAAKVLGKEDLLSVASGWLNRSFGQPDKPHCLSNLVLPIGRFIDLGQLLCASHSLESCSIPGFVNSINELKVPKRPQKKQQNIGKARHKVAILQVPKRKGRKKRASVLIWLVVQQPSSKTMEFVNGVGMASHIWKLKFMFQTTNQSLISINHHKSP